MVPHPAAGRAGPLDLRLARRALVVRPDNLGDVVLLTPALRALRAALPPAARLDLLATPAGAAVVPLVETLDGVLEVRSVCWQLVDGRPFDPAAQSQLVSRIAAGRYDLAVIFTSFSQSPWVAGYVCALAGIPVRVGASREFGGSVLTHWVDDLPDGLHQADRALALLDRCGVPGAGPTADRGLSLRVPREATARVRLRWLCLGSAEDDGPSTGDGGTPPKGADPYAVLLPGASCASRRYPASRFAQVAGRLAAAGLRVLVVGTAREAELVDQVRHEATGRHATTNGAEAAVVALAGELTLPELAALLQEATVVVTNNSGGAHLADAVRAPVVTLFAGTERDDEYRPRSGAHQLLRRPTPCAPCRAFVCRYHHECLDIPAEEVACAALRLARRADRSPSPSPSPSPRGDRTSSGAR
ncbi:glycosyltransferase family 9 protein [Frankia sp. EI5c]|uniref:glycosyltransferase family 9 protein n=1 Tax=Frankia sp. EI5c TaxID=683316 RepID=UPI001F5B19A3|nr:glycosyltransferase family 9 protein [Frankia sp. EI5c]